MNLLLINLCLRPKSFKNIFPIGFGYIATAVEKAGIKFDLLDMDINKYDTDVLWGFLRMSDYNVIAFGCIVTGYKLVKEVSKVIREALPKCVIICGNTVASSIPEILLKNTEVNIAVLGEGDRAIVEILKDIKNGKAGQGRYMVKPIEDINTLSSINWDLFDIKKYIEKNKSCIPEPYPLPYEKLRAMPLNTARGCIYRCSFCYHAFYNYRYRYRSIEVLDKEINLLKKKYNVNYITCYDDLTLFSKRRAEEFAEMMTGKDIYWTACCRDSLFTEKDRGLVKKLKKSNCVSLGYSLESANKEILKAMNKNLSVEGYRIQKRVLDKESIATLCSLVIGYPQETEATLKETFDFCYDNDIFPSTGYLLPQPGSPMYHYAINNGYIRNEEAYLLSMGDRQDLRLNMTSIPNWRLESLVVGHLKRIRDKLSLNLDNEHLIKTGVVRVK